MAWNVEVVRKRSVTDIADDRFRELAEALGEQKDRAGIARVDETDRLRGGYAQQTIVFRLIIFDFVNFIRTRIEGLDGLRDVLVSVTGFSPTGCSPQGA